MARSHVTPSLLYGAAGAIERRFVAWLPPLMPPPPIPPKAFVLAKLLLACDVVPRTLAILDVDVVRTASLRVSSVWRKHALARWEEDDTALPVVADVVGDDDGVEAVRSALATSTDGRCARSNSRNAKKRCVWEMVTAGAISLE